MSNNDNNIWRRSIAVTRVELRTIPAAVIATVCCVGALSSSFVINYIYARGGEDMSGNMGLSVGWALWLLPVLGALLIASRNFRRIIGLGGKREPFFRGSLLAIAVLAVVTSGLGLLVHYAVDLPLIRWGGYGGLFTVPGVCGWDAFGPAVFFLQQAAFLFLSAAFAYTLAGVQGHVFGWFIDAALIAGICVFPSVEPLRELLVGYFHTVMLQPNALIQVPACLAVGLAMYMANRPVFARKVI